MEKRIGLITTVLYSILSIYAVGSTYYVLQQFPHSTQEMVSVGLTIFAVFTITIFSALFLIDRLKMSK